MRERKLNGIIGYLKQGDCFVRTASQVLISISADFIEVIEALSNGSLKAEDMITAKIPLNDLVEKGFR